MISDLKLRICTDFRLVLAEQCWGHWKMMAGLQGTAAGL